MVDLGDVTINDVKVSDPTPEQEKFSVKNLHLLDPMLEEINNRMISAIKSNPDSLMVTVGGDHSIGSATYHAINSCY